jgi:hypothetical protein
MSKRHGRPWERKKGIDRFSTTIKRDVGSSKVAPDPAITSSSTPKTPTQQPPSSEASKHNALTPSFMNLDGHTYFADRFYLMKPEGGVDNSEERSDTGADASNGCTCGAHEPPPTLDRRRLIKSLSLKAAIVATFTLSPSYLDEMFDDVPTLVLHGHKGLHNRIQRTKSGTMVVKKREEGDKPPLKKQKLSDVSNQHPTSTTSADPIQSSIVKKEEEEAPPEEAWFAAEESEESVELPETMHLTQILSAWLPPSRVSTSSRKSTNSTTNASSKQNEDDYKNCVIELLDDSDNETLPAVSFSGIDAHTARQRRSKRGVHHPKFMMLFETSGSLVVVVSTSNLTTPKGSVDGIWVQRFFPVTKNDTTRPKKKMPERRMDGSDFGYVLADFLQKQSNAARVGQMLPLEFMQHYVNLSSDSTASLESCLADAYQFEASQVHLIATIPGDYMGRNAVTHWGKRNASTGQRPFLYGPQRVHDIMVRLAEEQKSLQSSEDRLICQPTSLGGHWTTSEMNVLANCYMEDGDEVMERMDIMWPTTDFIKRIQKTKKPSKPEAPEAYDAGDGAGFLFLSSQSFNTIDIDCISRMAQYEHSSPQQMSSLRCPHFKSYARLFEGNEYELRRKHDVGKAAEIFTWFLMTSACLSRGAQGFPTTDRMEGSDQVSYANFELGILFCSKLQTHQGDSPELERVYCFKPNQCACESKRGINKKLIHLPIPYDMRGQPYQTDEEEAHMCKTPYFHEITPETACVGLMALTPFGKARAAKQTSRTLDSALP